MRSGISIHATAPTRVAESLPLLKPLNLRRRYISTSRVALLRAANIPAHLALLDSGTGLDVNPDLPGMNEFDHAIVYVPAGKTKTEPAIWIDATAEFFQVGSLPYDDEGRMALIVSPETKGLTRTPLPKPEAGKA